MPALRIHIEGADRARAALTPALYQEAVGKLIREMALLAERNARMGAPKDTGALARSIVSDVRGLSATVGTNLAYAETMEYGRRAGARMPPPEALRGWMRRHGITTSPFVIARAIARRGLAGRFFMRKAVESIVRAFPALAREAGREIEARWGR